ncbi:helix-turn-helix domain-containing protein [Gordonia sputi]|uniref:helix-turn-helix domain-containing protein n=1 Tax=Gordonia sputi TaxID=36823 RepID=UPI00369CD56A
MAEATSTRLDDRAVEAWKHELKAARPDSSMLMRGESGIAAYSAGFGRVTVSEPASFVASVFYRPLSVVHALCALSTPRHTERTADDVAAQEGPPLVIAAVHRLAGTLRLRQFGRTKRYLSNQLALITTASPFVGEFDAVCESAMLMIPAHKIDDGLTSARSGMLPTIEETTLGLATAGFVRAFAVDAAVRNRPVSEEDELAAISLIRSTIGYVGAHRVDNTRLVIAAAREATERHFADPEFTADVMAELLGIGRRPLYRHFVDSEQSPAELIVARRVAYVRELLDQHDSSALDVVAAKSGFTSAALLRKHFRDEFKMTPNEYRAAVTRARPQADRGTAPST